MVEIWRSTLTEVANLSGWDLQDRHETEFIQDIVEEMWKRLNPKFSRINKNLIGQSRLWLVEDLFNVLENNMATNTIQAIVIVKKWKNSKLEYLWEGTKCLGKLKSIDLSCGGVAFTILNHYLEGLFCQKLGYETATKRKEDGSKTEFQIIIPGCLVPRWLTHRSWGNSISVVLSPNWCNSRWMGFTLCAYFNGRVNSGWRTHVKAIGDMPHSQYISKFHFGACSTDNVCLLYLSRDDWFSTVGNGECNRIEVVFGEVYGPTDDVLQCGVSLVYEQDMKLIEELNQANAQCCSSSRVITYEGWDGVHCGFVNSKRSCDECDDSDEFDECDECDD
ncbi:hypothetical protein CMV_025613 [Castanea mollissima]|nr:hypothetical protein CMV_025613 [Castanea mollissima]